MVLTSGKMVSMQVIASLMADEALGNVTGAFLESDTLQRENKKLLLRGDQVPGLLPRQLLEVVVPLHGLNDSPKRWFLQTTSVLELLGWKLSALDECVGLFSCGLGANQPKRWRAHCACMSTPFSWEGMVQHIEVRWMR